MTGNGAVAQDSEDLWDWADVLAVAEMARHYELSCEHTIRLISSGYFAQQKFAATIRRVAAICDPPRCRTCSRFSLPETPRSRHGWCRVGPHEESVVAPDGSGFCSHHFSVTPLDYLRVIWVRCNGCVTVSALAADEQQLVAKLIRRGFMYQVDDIAMPTEAGREAVQ